MTYTELDHKVTIQQLKHSVIELADLAIKLTQALEYEAIECGIDNYAESTVELIEESRVKLGLDK